MAVKQKIAKGVAGVSALIFPAAALAQSYGLPEAASKANYATGGSNTIYSWVNTGISALLAILGFVFFGLMLYAGVMWMIARGNDEKASEAKGTIEAAVIGLVLVMAAFAVTQFVFGQLGK